MVGREGVVVLGRTEVRRGLKPALQGLGDWLGGRVWWCWGELKSAAG